MATRWGERNNTTHESEPAKHLSNIVTTGQSWQMLLSIQEQERT